MRAADAGRRREAGDLLARAYWGPVRETLRVRWRLEPADADDLTQEFFATALEKRWLDRFDPARGRFRTFLRVCADRFAANAHQAAGRARRGGGVSELSLDDALVGDAAAADPDELFRAEWVRGVFALALDALRKEAAGRGRGIHLALFEAYDVADVPDDARPTYASLAAQHGLGDTQVINHLAWARRRFRVHVLEVVRRLAGSDAEYRDDVRELLGIGPP